MKRLALSFLITACTCVCAIAQLSVTSENMSQVVGLESAQQIGDLFFVDSATPVSKKAVVVVRAETDAANVSFEVSDSSRSPVPFDYIADGTISISKTGKSWVEVVALDFDKNIYSKKVLVVVLDGYEPDIDVLPDGVKNDYGLGLIAYEQSPDENKKEVSAVYESGANFLYGKPKAKTVSESLAWIKSETEDQTGGAEQWKIWQSKISDALVVSQERTVGGYSRENWFQALMEVSNALKAKK